jgi:conjugative relaxase-like TrwC/TraI family protein
MLRITPQYRAESVQRYFVEALCKDDYYTHGTEEPGLWRGRAAELLGLDGPVDRESFSRLTQNRHPFKEERLTPRDRDGRRVGYDITFSPPKSVSVLYAVTRDEDVLWAFRKSVWDTMQEMEASMATRVRRDGANHDRPTGNMVWSEYLHFTTRPVDGEPDPHLHIHNFSHNCTFDEDEQRFKAAQFGVLKSRAPYFEAVALSKLAANLVSVGYQVERTEHAFEVIGVPTHTLSEFSRRTQLIESIASELGFEQERKAALGAKTRERKTDEFTLDELHERWSARLSPEDITAIRNAKGRPAERVPEAERQQAQTIEAIKDNIRQPELEREPTSDDTSTRRTARRWHSLVSLSANNAVKLAIAELFERDAIITEDRLYEVALHLSFGKAEREQIRDAIEKRPGLIRRTVDGTTYLTTREAVAEERELVRFAKEGRNSVRQLGIDPLSLSVSKLDHYERAVLRKLMESTDRITLFKNNGPTRKPELVRAALTGLQQNGHRLVVVAPNATSAREAEQAYGVKEVQTVHQVLANDEYRSIAKNIVPKVFKTVFWVEDAGRLGTRTIAELGTIAKRTGARLVLTGDEDRARKYERGDPFRLLREEARLHSVERRVVLEQQNGLERAVDSIVHDSGGTCVNTLEQLDKLQVVADSTKVFEHAADFFAEQERAGRSAMLVTPTPGRASVLTDMVRNRLRADGTLTGREKTTVQLVSAGLTRQEMRRSENYRRGMVIDFFQPTRGFASGDRTRVIATDPANGVWVWGKLGNAVRLNLSHVDRFTVSTVKRTNIAVGDRIRLTRRTRALIGKPINAGTVVTVTGFNPFGQVAVSGGRVLPRSLGHFEHDYVTTSSKLHGRRADAVAFVADSGGWGGAESKDIAAAGEAARKDFRVVVDDRENLVNILAHVRPVLNATELEDDPDMVDVELSDYAHRFRRMQPDNLEGLRFGH